MVKQSVISVETHKRTQWIDITDQIRHIVAQSGIINGICTSISLHTTAAVTVNENADPDVGTDFFRKLSHLIPLEPFFRHSEGNSDSHIKAALIGFSVQTAVTEGDLVLGVWQSIYFCEFDGPRNRRVSVTIVGD